MKYLFVLIVIVASAYFYPQIIESKGGPCQAFEAKLMDELGGADRNAGLLLGLASGVSNGELGKRVATREYESLPTGLACVRAYYTLNADDIRL